MLSIAKGREWGDYGATWKAPGFAQGPTHPVVGVSWNDAQAFCSWLSRKERAANLLSAGLIYRLPTDEEWSVAVGLGPESGGTPAEKGRKDALNYRWGRNWPPPQEAGNFAGEEAKTANWPELWDIIHGYHDGWSETSPVGAFSPNRFGLYDMGSNVSQWCLDGFSSNTVNPLVSRVVRGGSWTSYLQFQISLSNRWSGAPGQRWSNTGFRCVLASAAGAPAGKH